MAIQGVEWLQALDAHHIENLDPARQRALLLEAAGHSNEKIAERESVSPSTVTG